MLTHKVHFLRENMRLCLECGAQISLFLNLFLPDRPIKLISQSKLIKKDKLHNTITFSICMSTMSFTSLSQLSATYEWMFIKVIEKISRRLFVVSCISCIWSPIQVFRFLYSFHDWKIKLYPLGNPFFCVLN